MPPATHPVDFCSWTMSEKPVLFAIDDVTVAWLRHLVTSPPRTCYIDDYSDPNMQLEVWPVPLGAFRIDGVEYRWYGRCIAQAYHKGRMWKRHYMRTWYASEFEAMLQQMTNDLHSPEKLIPALAAAVKQHSQPTTQEAESSESMGQ